MRTAHLVPAHADLLDGTTDRVGFGLVGRVYSLAVVYVH